MNKRIMRKFLFFGFSLFIFAAAVAGADDALAQNSLQPPALPSGDIAAPRDPALSLMEEQGATAPNTTSSSNNLPPERTKEEAEAAIRKRAFDAAITGLLPLRDEDIRKLLETFDKTKQATEIPVHPYPEPEVVVETVPMDPGAKPLEIKVAGGHVTTLTMLDVSGAPWPIQDISWAGNFEIVQPDEGGHVLRITPTSDFAYGNLSMRMLKLKTPLTFTLKAHRDTVHYRFDARIPEYGPYAQAPLIDGGLTIAAGDSVLGAILDGVPPPEAEKLKVSGVDGRTRAYKYNAMTYVRTPLTLLSPGWSSSVSSADGMKVYTVSDAPVLILSDQGKMVRAYLGNQDNTKDE